MDDGELSTGADSRCNCLSAPVGVGADGAAVATVLDRAEGIFGLKASPPLFLNMELMMIVEGEKGYGRDVRMEEKKLCHAWARLLQQRPSAEIKSSDVGGPASWARARRRRMRSWRRAEIGIRRRGGYANAATDVEMA